MRKKRTAVYAYERRLFYSAVSFVLLMFASYVYFVSASIVHIIVRKEVTEDIATVNATLGELETRYIATKHRLDEGMVAERGFSPIADRVFITKTSASLVLSQNDES